MTPASNPSKHASFSFGPTTVLFVAVIALVVAGLFWRSDVGRKLNVHVEGLESVRRTTETQREELSRFKNETEKTIGSLPEQQATLRSQLTELEESIAPIREQLEQLEVESMTRQIENDRQLARAVQLRNLGCDTIEVIDQIKDDFKTFKEQRHNIEKGLVGKQIAANEDLLELYAAVTQPDSRLERLAKWKNEVDIRLGTVNSIDEKTRSELFIDSDAIREFQEIQQQAAKLRKQLGHRRAALDEIVARAKLTPVTNGAVPLSVAIEQRKRRLAFEIESAGLERAQEKAHEQAEQLANARAKTMQRRMQASLSFESRLQELVDEMSQGDRQALADTAARIRQESENRHALATAGLERQRKESAYQAALPEIREYLVPFISKGNTQPRKRHAQYETAANTGPVSLSKLKSHGALEDSPRGLFVLHALGAGSSNDRPSGRFPPYYGGSSVQPRQVPFFRKVQQLLREHGELMVKNGLLAE